jgi:plastocyanin
MPSVELGIAVSSTSGSRGFLRSTAEIFAVTVMIAALAGAACRKAPSLDEQAAPVAVQGPTGAIAGHVQLEGPPPPPERIRMNADPMCAKANDGKEVTQADVVVGADGALANVFVQLTGDFPATAVPSEAVTVDQRGCVYLPRVVGVRAGQALVVHNDDAGLHNVHGLSPKADLFNVSQPMAGMSNTFHPMEQGILTLKCDVHTWMVAHVGVVKHPYFAVTDGAGGFTIRNVPVGTHTLQIWHERFGTRTAQVTVEPDKTATVDLKYTSGT